MRFQDLHLVSRDDSAPLAVAAAAVLSASATASPLAATMSSSVASGKVMGRWARAREEAKNPRVQTKKDAQDKFNAMQPNFKELERFEEKAERLVDRLEQRENGLEVEEVINVMGSTAGAGSGCAAATHGQQPCAARRHAPPPPLPRAHHACVRGGAGTSTRIVGTAPRSWRACVTLRTSAKSRMRWPRGRRRGLIAPRRWAPSLRSVRPSGSDRKMPKRPSRATSPPRRRRAVQAQQMVPPQGRRSDPAAVYDCRPHAVRAHVYRACRLNETNLPSTSTILRHRPSPCTGLGGHSPASVAQTDQSVERHPDLKAIFTTDLHPLSYLSIFFSLVCGDGYSGNATIGI